MREFSRHFRRLADISRVLTPIGLRNGLSLARVVAHFLRAILFFSKFPDAVLSENGWRNSETPLPQANADAMIARRARAAGIKTKIGNHSFRATGITAYLKNGGTLEKAASMANHASTHTTQLYDRRPDEMSLDEVERIVI
jgi:integrase